MDIRVDGQVVLVTGGTQGVGRAIALEAARSGASGIMVTGRNRERGATTVADCQALGTEAAFVEADLGEADAPSRVVAETLARFGRIDALANAAAVTDRGSVAEAEVAFFDHLFAVNARGPMFLMQGVIRHLRDRAVPGAIVNILSINAHGATPELAIYGATKAAMALLTKNAAYAHRFDRIRVNGINLGWADTPGERTVQGITLGKGDAWLAEAEAAMPWKRLVKPEDVARLAIYLLSEASIPMTGSLIDQEQNYVVGVRD